MGISQKIFLLFLIKTTWSLNKSMVCLCVRTRPCVCTLSGTGEQWGQQPTPVPTVCPREGGAQPSPLCFKTLPEAKAYQFLSHGVENQCYMGPKPLSLWSCACSQRDPRSRLFVHALRRSVLALAGSPLITCYDRWDWKN